MLTSAQRNAWDRKHGQLRLHWTLTEHRGQSDGIVSLQGPIIQDPFPCAELEQAARVSVVILSEDSLKWAAGSAQGRLGGQAGRCTEVVMTLRVPTVSLFMEEEDKAAF